MTKMQFEEQVIRAQNTLYRVSSTMLKQPMDQHDAVQSCLLNAWKNRYALRDPKRFVPWLLQILVNECKRQIKRRKNMIPMEEMDQYIGVESIADSTLRDMVSALPEKERLPVVLHYIEGFSVQEVAVILKTPVGTVKTRMRSARKKLRMLLQEEA